MYNTISIVCVIYGEVTLYNKQTWSLNEDGKGVFVIKFYRIEIYSNEPTGTYNLETSKREVRYKCIMR